MQDVFEEIRNFVTREGWYEGNGERCATSREFRSAKSSVEQGRDSNAVKLVSLEENSSPWRICDFDLRIALADNIKIHHPVGVEGDHTVVPIGDEDISLLPRKPFPDREEARLATAIDCGAAIRLRYQSAMGPVGDWISLPMRSPQRSHPSPGRTASPTK